MRYLLILIAFGFTLNGTAQQKDLTLEEAVLSYSKGLTPENLKGIKWFDDSNKYLERINDYYTINFAEVASKPGRLSLIEFHQAYPELEKTPNVVSINSKELVFKNENQYEHFDYINKKAVSTTPFNSNAKNLDYNTTNKTLAYTIKNNLYIAKPLISGKEHEGQTMQVTSSDDPNVISGQAIHRYEFGIVKGTFWSPKGNYLAFYQKDEIDVSNYPLVDVTTYPASLNNIKYPMAGQKSEQAKIGVYNLKMHQVVYLEIDTKDEHYLTNLSWSPDEKLVFVAEVNRAQNHMTYNSYDAETGKKVNTLFEEKNDRWVEPEYDAVFLPNSNTEFLWMSERDGFMNLYHYNTSGKLIKQLTKFKFVVNSILGFDKAGGNVFVSARGKDARNSHVFKVSLKNGKKTNITPESGVHHAQLSATGDYLIDNYSSLTIPRKIDMVITKTGKSRNLFTAENPLKEYNLGTTEMVTLKAKDKADLYGRLIKPNDFDVNKKYPVLIYMYGGTHAQLVTNRWLGGASLWMHWLATQKDYIVFTLDNRGSENRGFEFESVVHRTLGDHAMEDQLQGAEYLKGLPYVDANRIAIKGWSYGGFMVSSLMMRHPDVFTVGAAGGPVTDWKYYEVMYGERYMDTPQENPEGYENARVGKYVEGLKGKLLIIHGSVDPTVVPQHSMTLLKEAVEKEVQIDFFTYPMHPHNVGGKDRVHLMTKMLDYIVEYNQ